jgi:hypothetical protein
MEWTHRNEWWIRLGRALHRLQHESGGSDSAGRLTDIGKSLWHAIIDRGQFLNVIRTDLPQDLLVAIVMGADQGGDRWMIEHWDEFSAQELKKIVDARVDLLRDMLDKENEGWEG